MTGPFPADDQVRLVAAARAVGLGPRGTVTWDGRPATPPARSPATDTPAAARARLVDRLTLVLYDRFYCAVPVDDVPAAPEPDDALVARLRRATGTRGRWEPGWRVDEVRSEGVTAHRDGLTVLVRPDRHRVPGGGPLRRGAPLELWSATELPTALPGFHLVLGTTAATGDEPLVRVYWHVDAAVAPRLVGELSRGLDAAGTSFQLKTVDHPDRYVRRDACVLYVPATSAATVLPLVLAAHRGLGAGVHAGTPALTLPLARGLAVAEDPGGASSFGTHRCRLVAEGLVRARERRLAAADAPGAVAACFVEAGLDPALPFQRHLDLRPWAEAARRQATRTAPRGRVAPRPTRDEHTAVDAVAVARRLGEALCGRAVWDGAACAWIAPRGDPRTGAADHATTAGDLYAGTAGLAWFLAELAAATGSDRAARTAVGAARHALWWAGHAVVPDDGLFTGTLGVVVAAEHVAAVLGRPDLRAAAQGLAHGVLGRLQRTRTADPGPDVVSGRAGMIGALLVLHRAWSSDAPLSAGAALGRALLASAVGDADAAAWPTPTVPASAPLTGLSHGASGPAWALAELAAATGERRFAAGALRAVRYEARCRVAHGHWPDLRADRTASRPGSPASLWCHGATGIGLVRRRLADLLHDDACAAEVVVARDLVRAEVERARSRVRPGWSLCHGLGGNVDALLHLSDAPGDAALGRSVAAAGAQHVPTWAGADHPPGLMTGTAGIGWFYLRLARPGLASVLLPTATGSPVPTP